MPEMKTLTLNNVTYDINDAEAIKYTKQSLTDKQKAQARENIGIADTNTTSCSYEINPDLNLLVFGDSIFGKEDGKNFIKRLGCNSRNYAVSGASLAKSSKIANNADGSYNSILDQFERFKSGGNPYLGSGEDINTRLNGNSNFTVPDMILVDGGANDYIFGVPMGESSDNPYTYDIDVTYDITTTMGALEKLLRDIAFDYPKAQRFFLIMHKTYHCITESNTGTIRRVYWHNYPNSVGYDYKTLRQNIIEVCNMYGFKIIDIYNDSLLNVVPPSYKTYQGNQVLVANEELFDYKGIHPTELGYKIGYEPYVKAALCMGTKK